MPLPPILSRPDPSDRTPTFPVRVDYASDEDVLVEVATWRGGTVTVRRVLMTGDEPGTVSYERDYSDEAAAFVDWGLARAENGDVAVVGRLDFPEGA